jgi:hypothetical protein
LPATSLVEECYREMFKGCTSLTNVKCLATDKSANCTTDWMSNVPATGIFVMASGAEWSRDQHGIPSGWTVNEE